MTVTAAALIEATRVTINWTEAGPFDGLSIEGDNVWAKANAMLSMLLAEDRRTVGSGYVKTNFTVEWADGDTYTGRIDLDDRHTGTLDHSLGEHINAYVSGVLAGAVPWATDEHRDGLRALCETHDITA
ncbi:MAG: hypothetical protein L0H93_02550 [Nocardioides sp.]|nr:hypothetical protein [Nocardioides sp.]